VTFGDKTLKAGHYLLIDKKLWKQVEEDDDVGPGEVPTPDVPAPPQEDSTEPGPASSSPDAVPSAVPITPKPEDDPKELIILQEGEIHIEGATPESLAKAVRDALEEENAKYRREVLGLVD